jgi:hypothetical protein
MQIEIGALANPKSAYIYEVSGDGIVKGSDGFVKGVVVSIMPDGSRQEHTANFESYHILPRYEKAEDVIKFTGNRIYIGSK